jgi:hypothetical protein
MDSLITIDRDTFNRMAKALIEVEKYIAVNSSDTWVDSATAMQLLGCKRSRLFELKNSGQIKYRRNGRGNQYNRTSIEKYNQKHSS